MMTQILFDNIFSWKDVKKKKQKNKNNQIFKVCCYNTVGKLKKKLFIDSRYFAEPESKQTLFSFR